VSGIGVFITEIRRRRVLSTATLYIVAAWVAIQVADVAFDAGVLRLALRTVFVAAFLGFPIALVVGWYYDITRRRIVRTAPVGTDSSFDGSLHKRDYPTLASLAAVWTIAEMAPPGSMFSSAAREPLYIFLGEDPRALDGASKTIEMEPAAPYTLANLRNHDLRAGRYLEALSALRQAIDSGWRAAW
jgi:hypothetical protein